MSAFDRFETRLPELMSELAEPSSPDYVNDMLRQTARTRQRPAWSALERWLPMGAIARNFLPVRFLPWRPLLVAALLVVLAVAAVVLYAGSRASLPAPFGPARNGVLLVSTATRAIVAYDLATGATKPVLADGGAAVSFSPDGQLFWFDKNTTGAPDLWVANADGTGSHHVWTGTTSTTWIEWSQDGRRLVIAEHPTSGGTSVHLVDANTGADTALPFDRVFSSVSQAYGSHFLVMAEQRDGQPTMYYLANGDGTSLRPLATVAAVNFPALSPDGTRIAYASWEEGYAKQGIFHVLDLATGVDKAVTSGISIWLSPVFSPDGTKLAGQRVLPSTSMYDIGIVAIDSGKAPVVLGKQHNGDLAAGVSVAFAPDGTKIIVRYADDATAWLFDVTGGVGAPLAGITTESFSWQRAGE